MIVYWSPFRDNNFAMTEIDQLGPERVLPLINKKYQKYEDKGSNFKVCPSFRELFTETYALRLTHDVVINIQGNGVNYGSRGPEFVQSLMRIRSPDLRIFGFNLYYLFVCEDDVEMSYLPAYFEDNAFNRSAFLIPGKYNIGKWVRPLECSFIVRDGVDRVEMLKGDAFSYLQFATTEKIEFKKFYLSEEMRQKIKEVMTFHKEEKPFKSMIPFYEVFQKTKLKQWFIKQIKQNLME